MKKFKLLVSLFISCFVCFGFLYTPIHAIENEQGIIESYTTEDGTHIEVLTYDRFVSDVAKLKGITIKKAETYVNSINTNGEIKIIPYSYQLKYARVTTAYDFINGYKTTPGATDAIVCGVYASYYVDSSNWQLRYWNAIIDKFIEPGSSLANLQVYSNYASIISNLRIDQHVSFRVSDSSSMPAYRTWTKDHSFYL